MKLNSQFLEYLALAGAGGTALCFPAAGAAGVAVSTVAGMGGLAGIGLAALKESKAKKLPDLVGNIAKQVAEEWRDGSNHRFARYTDLTTLNAAQNALCLLYTSPSPRD